MMKKSRGPGPAWYLILAAAFPGCHAADLVVTKVEPTWVRGTKRVDVTVANRGFRDVTDRFSVKVAVYKRVLQGSALKYSPEMVLQELQWCDGLARGEERRLAYLFPDPFDYGDLRMVVARVDVDDRINEVSEGNNDRETCLAPPSPASPCWLGGTCLADASDIDLTVRSANTKEEGGLLPPELGTGGWPRYASRLDGIARAFFADWPEEIGLIGMQEVRSTMTTCPEWPASTVDGGRCFAKKLEAVFSKPADSRFAEQLAVIADGHWEILSSDHWQMGHDSGTGTSSRWLLETKLRHRARNWTLRFYSTHLSHPSDMLGTQEAERNEEIRNLTAKVAARASSGELPPVLAGDLNFIPASEPSSNSLMQGTFALLNEEYVDCNGIGAVGEPLHVWVGRRAAFPNSLGRYAVIRFATSPGREGLDLASSHLTDHPSIGFSLKVVDAPW